MDSVDDDDDFGRFGPKEDRFTVYLGGDVPGKSNHRWLSAWLVDVDVENDKWMDNWIVVDKIISGGGDDDELRNDEALKKNDWMNQLILSTSFH